MMNVQSSLVDDSEPYGKKRKKTPCFYCFRTIKALIKFDEQGGSVELAGIFTFLKMFNRPPILLASMREPLTSSLGGS